MTRSKGQGTRKQCFEGMTTHLKDGRTGHRLHKSEIFARKEIHVHKSKKNRIHEIVTFKSEGIFIGPS